MKKFFIIYFDILGYKEKIRFNDLTFFNTINTIVNETKNTIRSKFKSAGYNIRACPKNCVN